MNVYDLDGVIVDTKEAWLRAYEAAGVARKLSLPNWGKSWRTWCSQAIYEAKNTAYPEMLWRYMKKGPLYHQYEHDPGPKHVLTATAPEFAAVIQDLVTIPLYFIGIGARDETRGDILRLLSDQLRAEKYRKPCRYYDDLPENANLVEGTCFEFVLVTNREEVAAK